MKSDLDKLKQASELLLDGDEGYKLERVAILLQENERLKSLIVKFDKETDQKDKRIESLESDRSDLVKLIGDFWESYRQFNAIPDELENRILKSIKNQMT